MMHASHDGYLLLFDLVDKGVGETAEDTTTDTPMAVLGPVLSWFSGNVTPRPSRDRRASIFAGRQVPALKTRLPA